MHWLDHVELARPAVSVELLRVAMPRCPDIEEWAEELSEALAWGGIHDPAEVAMFLAQVGHESADLTRLSENLNYSVAGLLKTFGRHRITKAQAQRYGRSQGRPADQQAIANIIYGGEWGRRNLGNTAPGDGWRHRGMGPIQLTGKANQRACQEATGLPILDNPERLATLPRYGAMASAWYWITRVTPGVSIERVTREVNGGRHGLADRRNRYERIMRHIHA
ncbi:hypothetical protein PRZ61_10795 [Halomonas pacifica]|uniref:glycoside hydrolase family 19 protein n=1 Tax=Bisbaumannia pacifica TaxID=77098 RepID=UPI00235A0DA2|nr:glycoside hydrolase family 19 protein [Halomonas pacifica]MDC8803923.1 hypothetical protein [Halomonas pacifica]